MERKIGEIFTYGDKRYQVVKVDFWYRMYI